MPKDAPAKSSKSMAGSLQLAKDYEDSGDIRRVRLPEDKLKDQFRLSFPERYLDRLTFDRSETFDKRLMQYRLSYLDSQSASKVNSTRRSHRTSSCSAINSKSPSIRSNSKVSTPTSKVPENRLARASRKALVGHPLKLKNLMHLKSMRKMRHQAYHPVDQRVTWRIKYLFPNLLNDRKGLHLLPPSSHRGRDHLSRM